MRVKYLLDQGYSNREIVQVLGKEGITRHAVDCALWKLKHGGFRHPFSKYCPNCLRPEMQDQGSSRVCLRCGVEVDTYVPLNESVGSSEPTSLARRDKGLGSDRKGENKLIMWIRREKEYLNGEGLTMRSYEDLAGTGDDAFTREVLKDVSSLGGFRERDFEVSEAAARLARRLCRLALMRYTELTRKRRHEVIIAVLKEVSDSFPARVRLDPSVREEVLEYGQ
jgi:hypothetical protein